MNQATAVSHVIGLSSLSNATIPAQIKTSISSKGELISGIHYHRLWLILLTSITDPKCNSYVIVFILKKVFQALSVIHPLSTTCNLVLLP